MTEYEMKIKAIEDENLNHILQYMLTQTEEIFDEVKQKWCIETIIKYLIEFHQRLIKLENQKNSI